MCPAIPLPQTHNTHQGCSKLYTSVTMYSFRMVHGGRFVLLNWNDLSHYPEQATDNKSVREFAA